MATLIEMLKEKEWSGEEIAVLANAILTYKKWYKRSWRAELGSDMMRSYYEPFGYGALESGILQTFRNECGNYLKKITTKDLQELEQYLA